MRNKTNLKILKTPQLFLTLPFLPCSSLHSISLPPDAEWPSSMVSRCFSQFIAHRVCRSFLLLLFPPHALSMLQHGVSPEEESFSNFSSVRPSHRMQFFRNASAWALCHRQSFRNTLLQHGSCLHRATGPARG